MRIIVVNPPQTSLSPTFAGVHHGEPWSGLVALKDVSLYLCLSWTSLNLLIQISNSVIGIDPELTEQLLMFIEDVFIEFSDHVAKEYWVRHLHHRGL